MNTNDRGISIGVSLIRLAAIVGVPSALVILALAYFVFAGLPLFSLGQATREPAMLAMLVAGALTVLAGLMFVVGLTIYVIAPSISPETARKNYASHKTVLACLILGVVIAGVLQILYRVGVTLVATGDAMALSRGQITPTALIVALASIEISLLFVLWIRIFRPKVVTWQAVGMTTESLGQRIMAGLGTGVLIFVAVGIVEFGLTQLGIEQTQIRQFAPVKNATVLQFAVLLSIGAGLAPFVEELFFRGYVFKAYLERKGPVQAYVFSSTIFALAHLDLRAALPIFVTGLILAHVFRVTRSVIPTMVAHAVNNAFAFTALYLGLA